MKTEVYTIEGMSCAACSSAVERVTRKLEGVQESNVNLTTGKMTIVYDAALVSPERIIEKVDKAGFHAVPLVEARSTPPQKKQDAERAAYRAESRSILWAAILSILLLYVSMGPMLVAGLPIPDLIDMHTHPVNYALIQLVLTVPILFIGRKFFVVGFRAIWHRNPNMDSLVAIGSACSFLYSLVMTFLITDTPAHAHHLYYESAAIVLTLVMLGKHLEAGSKRKTMGAIEKLTELAPDTAILLCEDGAQREVPSETLKIGDLVLVRPGARVPVDGEVVSGTSGVDEKLLTGESMPVEKAPGDAVIGGSINQNGALTVRVTRVGEDTTLAKIVRFVEDAQGKKAPISKIADRVAGVFVPVVMLIALVASLAWAIVGKDIGFILRVFTSVLVIACPCALGLATPTAIIVGTGLGASHGILIRSGEALEVLHKADVAVLDKTGTVTEGNPVVSGILCANASEDKLLSVAAEVESASQHPLAEAIVRAAEARGLQYAKSVSVFENQSGKGVVATLSDGRRALVGNMRLMSENGVDFSGMREEIDRRAQDGETAVLVAMDGQPLGVIAISDAVKQTSREAVARMREMGLKTVLLTGDNARAANHIGSIVGADEVIAEVLPQDKAEVVRRYQDQHKTVLMVGDGINDAPALTQADVGCAIGNGSDIAIESADVVLMKNDLNDVCRALRLSRLTIRNIKENLFWAFLYNTIGIPIAAGALYWINGTLMNPMLAGLAMSLSSVCVVGNALRLRGKKL